MTDHHGTPVAAIPNGGNPAKTPVKRLYTDPFGATRGISTASTVPGGIQFLGKNRDTNSGLTLLGARYYDEAAGGFISVDPVLDLLNPQQWNGYAYSGNNPLTYADASGLLMQGWTDYSTYNPHTKETNRKSNSSSSANAIVAAHWDSLGKVSEPRMNVASETSRLDEGERESIKADRDWWQQSSYSYDYE
ncbi:RHS repeat-associated core domain-containing protein [Agromyces sp. NPDC055658]